MIFLFVSFVFYILSLFLAEVSSHQRKKWSMHISLAPYDDRLEARWLMTIWRIIDVTFVDASVQEKPKWHHFHESDPITYIFSSTCISFFIIPSIFKHFQETNLLILFGLFIHDKNMHLNCGENSAALFRNVYYSGSIPSFCLYSSVLTSSTSLI